jgi:hypothetical protein
VVREIQFKASHSHLHCDEYDERVVVIRVEAAGVDETTFLWSPLTITKPGCIDHLFLTVKGNLLECW